MPFTREVAWRLGMLGVAVGGTFAILEFVEVFYKVPPSVAFLVFFFAMIMGFWLGRQVREVWEEALDGA